MNQRTLTMSGIHNVKYALVGGNNPSLRNKTSNNPELFYIVFLIDIDTGALFSSAWHPMCSINPKLNLI